MMLLFLFCFKLLYKDINMFQNRVIVLYIDVKYQTSRLFSNRTDIYVYHRQEFRRDVKTNEIELLIDI